MVLPCSGVRHAHTQRRDVVLRAYTALVAQTSGLSKQRRARLNLGSSRFFGVAQGFSPARRPRIAGLTAAAKAPAVRQATVRRRKACGTKRGRRAGMKQTDPLGSTGSFVAPHTSLWRRANDAK